MFLTKMGGTKGLSTVYLTEALKKERMVNQFEVGEMIRKEQKCSLHADYQVT